MIMINPGSEGIKNTTVDNALNNIKHFVTDLNDNEVEIIRYEKKDYVDGRYCFLLKKGNYCHEIQMPGLPLENVRWTNEEQNIWNYPRLYVDDSSWVWRFALNICNFKKR